MKAGFFALALALIGAAPALTQTPEIQAETDINWTTGEIRIALTIPIDKPLHSAQSARTDAEELAKRYIDSIFYREMFPLLFDSVSNIQDKAINAPDLLSGLAEIGRNGRRTATRLDSTLSSAIITYAYSMYPDLVSVFIKHQNTYLPEIPIGFYPSSTYTGLVIYAKGSFPVHGEDAAESLRPALLPKIYDTKMNLITESTMVEPEYLSYWGVVRYTEDDDYLFQGDRVGPYPLVTMARKVFGNNRCDLIIPEEVALKVLANRENRKLISQGRILVICDLP